MQKKNYMITPKKWDGIQSIKWKNQSEFGLKTLKLTRKPSSRNNLHLNTLLNVGRLCDKIDAAATDDVYSLFESLSNIYADVVQYNKDNRFTPSATSNITIDDICLTMVDPAILEPIDR